MNNKLKHLTLILLIFALPSSAQIRWGRAISGLIKASRAYTMDDETFANAVKQSVSQMDAQARVAPANNKYAQRLKRICAGLTNADGLKLNFKVYITSDVNAFACPDGSVRVYSGIMDLLNDNELLGVLGHEIGHVALKHSYKEWKDQLYRSAMDDAVSSISDSYASLSNSTLGSLSGALISAKHSRYQETQADDYGYDFLKKSGKNPWVMAITFEKMKAMSESKDPKFAKMQKWLTVFSSHPDYDSRIKHLSDRAKKDGFRRP